jgi:DegV family protein with EDD domain
MDKKFRIISDSSCDLSPEECAARDIAVVPFYVSFGGEEHRRERVEIQVREFYERMVAQPGVFPITAAPAPEDFAALFEESAARDEAVICICITEKFSCSTQSARIARDLTLEKYPEARIAVINSLLDTVAQGLLTLEAARLRDEGVAFREAVTRLEAVKESGRIFFTIGSMDYLRHGGRIGKLTGIVGSLLDIRPLITLREGEIFPSGVGRGRKTTRDKVRELACRHLAGCAPDAQSVVIGFGYNREEAEIFRGELLEALGWTGRAEIPLRQIGAAIAVHTGPHPLGVGVLGRA